MVSSNRTASRLMIVARPDQSATWRDNLLVLLALAVPSLGAGIGFALAGAWPILPLAGLEMLALGSALYYVNWKLQYRHVITVSADSVRVDKGYYAPRDTWQFPRQSAGLTIVPGSPAQGPGLCLHDRDHSVSLGEFLNAEERLQLSALLQGEIRVRADSERVQQTF